MKPFLPALALVFLLAGFDPSPDTHAGSGRTLELVSLSHNQIGIAASGWTKGPVVLALSTGPWVVGRLIEPVTTGSFRVAAIGTNLCAGLVFSAADLHGHHRSAHGPSLGCAAPANLPRPRLKMLMGTLLQPAVIKIIGQHPVNVSLHLKDEVYLREPGPSMPMFSPTADARYLALIQQAKTPTRICNPRDCAQGFSWTWVAIRTGETIITLSASCRKATPPCMIPDFAIRVRIER